MTNTQKLLEHFIRLVFRNNRSWSTKDQNKGKKIKSRSYIPTTQQCQQCLSIAFKTCMAATSGIAFGTSPVNIFKSIASEGDKINPMIHRFITKIGNMIIIPSSLVATIGWTLAYLTPMLSKNEGQTLYQQANQEGWAQGEDLALPKVLLDLDRREQLTAAIDSIADTRSQQHDSSSIQSIMQSYDQVHGNLIAESSAETALQTYEKALNAIVSKRESATAKLNSTGLQGEKRTQVNSELQELESMQKYLDTEVLCAHFINATKKLRDRLESEEFVEKIASEYPNDTAKQYTIMRAARILSESYQDKIDDCKAILTKNSDHYYQAKTFRNTLLNMAVAFEKHSLFKPVGWEIYFTEKPTLAPNIAKIWLERTARFAGKLNAIAVNSLGVGLCVLGGIQLVFPASAANQYLPGAMVPLQALFGLGMSSGLVCAWFLTQQSFLKVVRSTFSSTYDPDHANSSLSKQIRAHKLELIKQHGERLWKHLAVQKIGFKQYKVNLSTLMALGFACSVMLMNFGTSISGCLLVRNPALVIRPDIYNSASTITQASFIEKASGILGAVMTLMMSGSLLIATAQNIRPHQQTPLQGTWSWVAYVLLTGTAASGQMLQSAISTIYPHMLRSLLSTFGVSEYLLQPAVNILGILVASGQVICMKLIGGEMYTVIDMLQKSIPQRVQDLFNIQTAPTRIRKQCTLARNKALAVNRKVKKATTLSAQSKSTIKAIGLFTLIGAASIGSAVAGARNSDRITSMLNRLPQ